MDDPERKTFHESHLTYYFSKYFKKQLDLKCFSVSTTASLMRMVQDTMVLDESSGMLESQLGDDSSLDSFVKLAEEHRRDRQRRLDAGDETAQLKFSKPTPIKPVVQAAQASAPTLWQKAPVRPGVAPAQRPLVVTQPGKTVAQPGKVGVSQQPKTITPVLRPTGVQPTKFGGTAARPVTVPGTIQPLRSTAPAVVPPGIQAAGLKRPLTPTARPGLIQPTKQARTYTGW
uniref:Uncharacterized protein n=1 Tax=Alexandrium catenella TaxID=2925 RepID=A0A7S1WE86_ALECA|mmetsp:Transcript_52985/g.141934  ORF Transcript_52985/g.141934 Transcript_52985/m.141934 type:complete len:230 (+) Transcript_52985:1-690(+)